MPQPIATWNTARDAWETADPIATPSLFCEHLDVYSETFPTSGTMRNGKAYAPQTWAPHTTASESSSTPHDEYLPTPAARDFKAPGTPDGYTRRSGERAQPLSEITNLLPTPRTSDTNGPGTHGQGGIDLRTAVTMLPTPGASDGDGGGRVQSMEALRAGKHQRHTTDIPRMLELLETPTSRPSAVVTVLQTPSVADSEGSHERRGGSRGDELLLPGQAKAMIIAWGPYEPAIRRWEAVMCTPSPPPCVPNSRGKERLNPAFPEWMMGQPAGWITHVDITRSQQLKACGNGVVTQQAIEALRRMDMRRTQEGGLR